MFKLRAICSACIAVGAAAASNGRLPGQVADFQGEPVVAKPRVMRFPAGGTAGAVTGRPSRPSAPISIPGYPIETASSRIRAPRYFAPAVAGDHGEPIAHLVHVGRYLVPNYLSANAHGNGYTDPNIRIDCVALGGGVLTGVKATIRSNSGPPARSFDSTGIGALLSKG